MNDSPKAALRRLVGSTLGVILLSHFAIDVLASIVPACLGVIEQTWQLTQQQSAWLLGLGSLTSGLSQPACAWLSDRTNSRVFGPAGLVLAACCIGLIGLAGAPWQLFCIYVVGMVGIGMFHPVGASTIGQLKRANRSAAVSFFFVAGMSGGVTGAIFGPRLLTLSDGFGWLQLVVVPGLLLAALLHLKIRHIDHRQAPNLALQQPQTVSQRWGALALLYVSAAMRFSVNMALVYLFVRWAENLTMAKHPEFSSHEVATAAAPHVGNLNALMIAGMAVGGLCAGLLVRPGREKWPLILVPMVFAPAIALLPGAPMISAYGLSFLSGVGFAAMVPVSLALAQRLLPYRTSLASGLMLGGAWALALFGPRAAEQVANVYGLSTAFLATSAALAVSGLVLAPISSRLVRATREIA